GEGRRRGGRPGTARDRVWVRPPVRVAARVCTEHTPVRRHPGDPGAPEGVGGDGRCGVGRPDARRPEVYGVPRGRAQGQVALRRGPRRPGAASGRCGRRSRAGGAQTRVRGHVGEVQVAEVRGRHGAGVVAAGDVVVVLLDGDGAGTHRGDPGDVPDPTRVGLGDGPDGRNVVDEVAERLRVVVPLVGVAEGTP